MRAALLMPALLLLCLALLPGCAEPAQWSSDDPLWGAWVRVDQQLVIDNEGAEVIERYQQVLWLHEDGSFLLSNAVVEQSLVSGSWTQDDQGLLHFVDELCPSEGIYDVTSHSGRSPYHLDDGYDLEISLRADSCPYREETLDALWGPRHFGG